MTTRILEDMARATIQLAAIGLAVAVLCVAGAVCFIARRNPWD